jgi:hypothetical protein
VPVARPYEPAVAFGWRHVAGLAALVAGVVTAVVLFVAAIRPHAVPPVVAVRVAAPARPAMPPAAPYPAREGLLPTAWTVRATPSDPIPQADRPPRTAAEFTAELARVPEVGLNTIGVSNTQFRTRPKDGSAHPVLPVIDSQPELSGLPLVRGQSCQLTPTAGQQLGEASQRLRNAFQDMTTALANPAVPSHQDILAPYRARLEEAGDAAQRASLLVQMLQCETDRLRELLIDVLGRTPGPAAGRALAHRALFEPDPALRADAVRSLKERPAAEVRTALLDAFRNPWPTAADHAADALIALDDRGVVPGLVRLLDEPDPAAPFRGDDGTFLVREMVRVNHLDNCLLCHAPSWNTSDVARSIVPSRSQRLPQSPGAPTYYGGSSADRMFARIDVTYLRPDFALMLDVANPGLWPARQRYDFLVRTRPAHADDVVTDAVDGTYPQREAALRALRRLTGQDLGDRSDDWRAGLRSRP